MSNKKASPKIWQLLILALLVVVSFAGAGLVIINMANAKGDSTIMANGIITLVAFAAVLLYSGFGYFISAEKLMRFTMLILGIGLIAVTAVNVYEHGVLQDNTHFYVYLLTFAGVALIGAMSTSLRKYKLSCFLGFDILIILVAALVLLISITVKEPIEIDLANIDSSLLTSGIMYDLVFVVFWFTLYMTYVARFRD